MVYGGCRREFHNFYNNPLTMGQWPPVMCGSGVIEPSPQEYSAAALDSLPSCGEFPTLPPRRAKWVKIQQPPRTICKKRYVYVRQKIYEPQLIPVQRVIDVPHVNFCYRRTRIPKVSYRVQVINEPSLIYEPKNWSGPILLTKPRIICEPQEICTTFICKPKPQYVYVPPPETWCCDPQGTVYTRPVEPCTPFSSNRGSRCPTNTPFNINHNVMSI